jgi:hypothetical protein
MMVKDAECFPDAPGNWGYSASPTRLQAIGQTRSQVVYDVIAYSFGLIRDACHPAM